MLVLTAYVYSIILPCSTVLPVVELETVRYLEVEQRVDWDAFVATSL